MVKRLVQNLLHKKLLYQIHGAAIEVRKDFGPGHKEKLYQKAFEEELKRRKISFEKEQAIKIYSPKDGQYIGLYRPDFIVDKKIIVEVKAEKFVKRDEFKRLYDYLRNSEYELSYFINFASPKLFVKRIIFTNDRKPFLKKLLVSIGLILVLLSGLKVEAAELKFDSQAQEFGVNQMFQVDLLLDTKDEEINAIEGKIIFPKDLLEIKEVLDGGSIINFWVEKARFNDNEIVFSGIIPGGFKGVLSPYYEGARPGKILSLILKTKTTGEGVIDLKDTRVLLNDSLGTPTQIFVLPFQFKITWEAPQIMGLLPIKDADPPEPFEPIITRDPNIFDNKWFLVFATQDKGSGISHYEILESEQKRSLRGLFEKENWQIEESPYVLKDQNLKSDIYVKAVDKAGNERIATLPAENPLVWYKNYFIWVKIILGVILAIVIGYLIRKFLWKRIIH